MQPLKPTVFAVLLAHIIGPSWAEYLLHTFSGRVGSGNYTYYKLSKEGNVRLILETTLGDSDLYISDQTLTPDFEIYDLKSATCGEDEVYIPRRANALSGLVSMGIFRMKLIIIVCTYLLMMKEAKVGRTWALLAVEVPQDNTSQASILPKMKKSHCSGQFL